MSLPNPTMDWMAAFLGRMNFYGSVDFAAGNLALTIDRIMGSWVITEEDDLSEEPLPVPLLWFRNDEQGSDETHNEMLVVSFDNPLTNDINTRFRRFTLAKQKLGMSTCTLAGPELMALIGAEVTEGLKYAADRLNNDKILRREYPLAAKTLNRFVSFAASPERKSASLISFCRPEPHEEPPVDDVWDQLRHTLRFLRNFNAGSAPSANLSFFCEDYVYRLARSGGKWNITEFKPPADPSCWSLVRGVWINNSAVQSWDQAAKLGIGLTPGKLTSALLEQLKRTRPYTSRPAAAKDRALDLDPLEVVLRGFRQAVDDSLSGAIKRESKRACDTVRELLHALAKDDSELALWSRSTK